MTARRPLLSPLASIPLPLEVGGPVQSWVTLLPNGIVVVSVAWTVAQKGVMRTLARTFAATREGDVEPITLASPDAGSPSTDIDSSLPELDADSQQSMVVAGCDTSGNLLLFDVEKPAPLHKFSLNGGPLGYARVRMLEPTADVAHAADGSLWWCAPHANLPLQRFDALGEPLEPIALQCPENASDLDGFLPQSIAIDASGAIWLSGEAGDAPAIIAIDEAGQLARRLPAGPLAQPASTIRIDHRQRLFAMEPTVGLHVASLADRDWVATLPAAASADHADSLELVGSPPRRFLAQAGYLMLVDHAPPSPPTLRIFSLRDH